jgi:dodecin
MMHNRFLFGVRGVSLSLKRRLRKIDECFLKRYAWHDCSQPPGKARRVTKDKRGAEHRDCSSYSRVDCTTFSPRSDLSYSSKLFEDEEWLAAQSAAADRLFNPQTVKEKTVSKSASTSSVYRVTELIGTSESSWEDAAKHAVETATKTLRDLRVAEVSKLDLVIVDGKVTAFRARVNLSFKYEAKD